MVRSYINKEFESMWMWATVPYVAPPGFYLEDMTETTNNDSRRPGLESNSGKLEVVLPCAWCRM